MSGSSTQKRHCGARKTQNPCCHTPRMVSSPTMAQTHCCPFSLVISSLDHFLRHFYAQKSEFRHEIVKNLKNHQQTTALYIFKVYNADVGIQHALMRFPQVCALRTSRNMSVLAEEMRGRVAFHISTVQKRRPIS